MTLKIVDAHFHFYDKKINNHPFLNHYDKKLSLLWGEKYQQQLPESYLPVDYFADMCDFQIEHLVMAELVSTNPVKEMHFAEDLAMKTNSPSATIASINLRDKNLASLLNEYSKSPLIRSVRDHLLWHPNNLQRCYTDRKDILKEPIVEESFAILQSYPFNYEFEIYAHDIPLVIHYAKKFPSIKFALHCFGWPTDQTSKGFEEWKKNMQELSEYTNVFVKITAIECIFGLNWSFEQIEPWIKETIAIFGASRCMFGSHLPITKLSQGASVLYKAYQKSIINLSQPEQQFLFSETAKIFYKL
jgi:predicted TIM-barrel fold metal-dependent hydrolase